MQVTGGRRLCSSVCKAWNRLQSGLRLTCIVVVITGRMLSWLAGPMRPAKGIRLGGDAMCAHTCQDGATHRTVLMTYRLALSRRRRGAHHTSALAWLLGLLPSLETRLTFWELDEVCTY